MPTTFVGPYVAEILARRDRVNAHVLGAVPALALPQLLLVNRDHKALEDGRREQHLDRLRRLHQVTGISAQFSAGDITVNAVVLRSKGDDTAEPLVDHARQHDFDIIATGTQAHTALKRHLTGSVSTALLRGAQCAVCSCRHQSRHPPPRSR